LIPEESGGRTQTALIVRNYDVNEYMPCHIYPPNPKSKKLSFFYLRRCSWLPTV